MHVYNIFFFCVRENRERERELLQMIRGKTLEELEPHNIDSIKVSGFCRFPSLGIY